MDRLINWLELPVVDMARAKAFYAALLGEPLQDFAVPGLRYALFPARSTSNAGALVQGEGYVPCATGPVVYLDASGRIDALVERVAEAGGHVLMPSTRLSEEAGDVALFLDSEGNRVGLQAPVPRPAQVSDGELGRLLQGAPRQFAFVLRAGPAHGPATEPAQWEHARNMVELLRSRRLATVTALLDGHDVLGVGTLAASSSAEVRALLDADPAVRCGRLVVEVLSAASFTSDDV